MASIDDLLDQLLKKETELNSDLINYYENETHSSVLCSILLKEIPDVELENIARILHSTMEKEIECVAFLNRLGVNEKWNFLPTNSKANWAKGYPIYLALKGPLQHEKSFGDVIKVILCSERLDVLRIMKPFVEKLLSSRLDSQCPKHAMHQLDFCLCKGKVETEKTFFENKADYNVEKCDIVCSNNLFPNQFKNYDQSTDRNKKLTVFILHTELDIDIAIQLSDLLKKEEITVRIMPDLEYLFMMNPIQAIDALFNIIDFFVPVVSQSFLKLIQPCERVSSSNSDITEEEFSNDMNIYYIYQLLLHEYIRNKCLNFRVRPVVVPGIKRYKFERNILLTCPLNLWRGVPKLIHLLKVTKEKFS